MRTPKRTLRGFTLVEMMIVLAVIGALLAIAVSSFRPVILNQGIKSAAFDLYSALQYARSEAIKRNGSVTLCAGDSTANDTQWTKGWRLDTASACTSATPLRSWTAASSVVVASTATPVTFAKDGHLTTTTPKVQIDPVTTLNGVTSRCVQVDLSGRPRTQLGACP
jgi:type IV fimbrial biogenesis protein FimT